MATQPSILAWEMPWTEMPDGLQSMESQKSQTRLSMLARRCKKDVEGEDPCNKYLKMQKSLWNQAVGRGWKNLGKHDRKA